MRGPTFPGVLVLLFACQACQPTGPGTATRAPVSEVRVADVADLPKPVLVTCPEGFLKGESGCLRVVHAGDAPTWKPPPGDPTTYDPCGAWSDPVGLVNCDPANETAAAAIPDAGKAK